MFKNGLVKICKGCNVIIPSRLFIGHRCFIMNNRLYCLNCHPLKCDLDINNESLSSVCKICNKQYKYNRNKSGRPNMCATCRVKIYRKRIKLKAVLYEGGKCTKCGYNKCLRALEFHHIDSSLKKFSIRYGMVSWVKIKDEVDKCDLLCANCHRELECIGCVFCNIIS